MLKKNKNEFELIKVISKMAGKKTSDKVIKGIGDDCAVVDFSKDKYLVLTVDAIVEDVHFDLGFYDFFDVGWKAIAVNLSDIASMGAVPRYALISIGAKNQNIDKDIEHFYKGAKKIAQKFNVDIVGGDTVYSPKKFFASVTLIGDVEKNRILYRDGAKAGDLILVTGEFGRASLINKGNKNFNKKLLKINPRVYEGQMISESKMATAMMDVSDGLAFSIGQICSQSGVGAFVDINSIPIAKNSNLKNALYFGEDFELVFTCKASFADIIKEKIEKRFGTKVSVIGKIVDKGFGINIKTEGFDHFNDKPKKINI